MFSNNFVNGITVRAIDSPYSLVFNNITASANGDWGLKIYSPHNVISTTIVGSRFLGNSNGGARITNVSLFMRDSLYSQNNDVGTLFLVARES